MKTSKEEAMTSHHDVAGVVAELRDPNAHYTSETDGDINLDRYIRWLLARCTTAADLLESKAKALSEAEASNTALWQINGQSSAQVKTLVGQKTEWMDRALAAEARLAELSRAMTEVRDWLILAGDMTCREIPLGIIARAQQESKDA